MSAIGTEPALLALVKDAVEDSGALVAGHVKLARAELGRDARAYARRATLLGVIVVTMVIGWAFACMAAALALARVLDPPLAYLAVGGFHLLAGGIGISVALARGPAAPRPLDETLTELDRTVSTLAPARLTTTRKRADGLA